MDLTQARSETVVVAAEEAGERLDRVLAARVAELSRSRHKALILAGRVAIDGATIRDPGHRVNAGGTIALDLDAAKGALERDVAEGLGLSTDMAAYAVYEMVSENMASAARVHAAERGAAVNQYNLIAFGGGAPLHAARVAEKIGVRRVIVPPNAGVGSAVGFLAAPVSYELVRSRYMRLDAFDAVAATELLKEMSAEATALVVPGARGMATFERRLAFMRYVGQGHEITIALPERPLAAGDAATFRQEFEREYARLFARFAGIRGDSWYPSW